MIICDVDGVLTDGKIIYDDAGRELKMFNVKDGLIVKHLREKAISVGIITGRESRAVSRRAEDLNFDFVYQGVRDKLKCLDEILAHNDVTLSDVAYLGDDLNDLPAMSCCGLAVVPADAPVYMRKYADVTTEKKGGEGVLREIADLILAAGNNLDPVIKKFTDGKV